MKIDSNKCVGCGQCSDVCPAVVAKNYNSSHDPQKCQNCQPCNLIDFDCPGEAICVLQNQKSETQHNLNIISEAQK